MKLPEGWKEDKFINVFMILKNNVFTRADMNYEKGMIQNIHYGDVLIKYDEILNCENAQIPFINKDKEIKISNFLNDGDVIIADTAEDETVGKAVEIFSIADRKILAGLHTIPCRPKKDFFVPRYLGYYINSPLFHTQLIPLITGIKVSSISRSSLLNTNILIPPLKEQQKIAEILCEQDTIISLKQKLLKQKQQQKKWFMQKLLEVSYTDVDYEEQFSLGGIVIDKSSWKKEKIKNIAEISSGSTPRRDEAENFNGNILWLTSGELKQKYISDTKEHISRQGAENSNLTIYKPGTVVIAIYGLEAAGIRGTCSIINTKCTISQACMAFSNFKNVTNEYFYYWYLQNGQTIGMRYAQGTKQQNLSTDLIGNLSIEIPSLPEQKIIAQVLSTADKEIALIKSSIEQEKQKKKSLAQLLLTGTVRVKI